MADNSTNEALKGVDEENSPKSQDENDPPQYAFTISKISDDESWEKATSVEPTGTFSKKDDLKHGANFDFVDVKFTSKGKSTERHIGPKWKRSHQSLPRYVCQVFEDKLVELLKDSDPEARENFPVWLNSKSGKLYTGIFTSRKRYEDKPSGKLIYTCMHKEEHGITDFFMPYDSRDVFSPIVFVRECLTRFGEKGDEFVLEYKRKKDYLETYSDMLLKSKNLIFRGAPGTGKSYLAKKIAAYLISDGKIDNYESLDPEREKQISEQVKNQMEFVQFHPSYDYSDFVEGLRPKANDDGTMGFELKDGIFKKFVEKAKKDESENFVFIIDEINRGDISKIFGELFFSIDPGYRGKAGEISTQYSNMHSGPDEKFYIPDNVYIIGTMNDIDRSVDSFDFAMRRRFRFVELKANADECTEMLALLEDEDLKNEAANRMKALNDKIAKTEDLNENYQIGAAYFLKLNDIEGKDPNEKFDLLWKDYLQPLLQEYIRGFNDEEGLMKGFKGAYDCQAETPTKTDKNAEDEQESEETNENDDSQD